MKGTGDQLKIVSRTWHCVKSESDEPAEISMYFVYYHQSYLFAHPDIIDKNLLKIEIYLILS